MRTVKVAWRNAQPAERSSILSGRMPTRRRRSKNFATVDRHVLYEAAVQDIEFDLSFFQRVYRQLRGRPLRLLREDFCGTARLACEWVRRRPSRRAWAVDLSAAT